MDIDGVVSVCLLCRPPCEAGLCSTSQGDWQDSRLSFGFFPLVLQCFELKPARSRIRLQAA